MWHSQLYTLTEPQNAGGINHPHEGNFGFDIDKNTQISDIAIFGSGRIRGGDGNAEGGVGLNGRFGTGTKITNVWIEHANVGVWVGRDYDNIPELWGPADGLEFSGMRIRNTYADGINFTNGTRNSRVFNSSFRTTGDDALAVWANKYVKDQSVDIAHDNPFVNNTIQLPWRANGIAIYGGYGNTIENNLIYDTMNYPGIMLATDHDPLPFSGQTLIANNGALPHAAACSGTRTRSSARSRCSREPGHPRRHHPRHRHPRLDLRRHPVQDRRRHDAERRDHQREDRQVQQRRRHPGHGRRPRQRDPDERDHHQLGTATS